MQRDYYFLLGVSTRSKESDIKKAYYERCRLIAPHQDPDLKLCSSKEMTEIIKAYNTLRDPALRRDYDSQPRFVLRTDREASSPEPSAPDSDSRTKDAPVEEKMMQTHFPKPVSDKEKQSAVHFQMGVSILSEHGGLEQAAQEFRLAVKYDPAHPGALYNLGLIAYQKGDFGEALSWFTSFNEHVKDSRDGEQMMSSLSSAPPKS